MRAAVRGDHQPGVGRVSALLAHAKALEALADAYEAEAAEPGLMVGFVARCNIEARVHRRAALSIREQAKAEATGEERS